MDLQIASEKRLFVTLCSAASSKEGGSMPVALACGVVRW